VELNQLDAATIRRAASAFAQYLSDQRQAADAPLRVLIACDARPITFELLAAAAHGLQSSGADVFELGSATSGSLSFAMAKHPGTAALLIGNSCGERHTISLRFWTDCGSPVSQHAGLETIQQKFADPAARQVRTFGDATRVSVDREYLEDVAPSLHGLRPLRIGLDTESAALRSHIAALNELGPCEFYVNPQEAQGDYHFRVRVDGDGEVCRFFDEMGNLVPAESTFSIVAREMSSLSPDSPVVVEAEATSSPIAALGLRPIYCTASRAAMFRAMRDSRASLGGGTSGRIWLGGDYPAADALKSILLLLIAMSRSDAPLSQVVRDCGR